MSYHNIRSKLDRALVAWIIEQEAGTSANTFPAKNSASVTLPAIICHTITATEEPPFSGNFTCQVEVTVRSRAPLESGEAASTTDDASDALVAAVFDCFHIDLEQSGATLAAEITTVAQGLGGDMLDLTLLNVRCVTEEGAFSEDSAAWEDTMTLEVYAVPSDVS